MRLFFFFPVARQTENTGPHTVTGVVVKTYFYIFFHCQFVKQTDILERTGDTRLIYLHGIHPGSVFSVQQNRSPGRLIYLSQQIEYRRLSRSVGTDQPRDLRPADGQIEVLHRLQPAEIDSEMARLQNGRFADITFRHDALAGDRHNSVFVIHSNHLPQRQGLPLLCSF